MAKTQWRSGRSWLHWMGGVAALLLPAVALGALTLPHTFEAGTTVSAAAMNENFAKLAGAIDTVSSEVSTIDGKEPGIPMKAPGQVTFAKPRVILKAKASGILYARPVSTGLGSVVLLVTVGDSLSNTDPPEIRCGGSPCTYTTRSFGGSFGGALVPANTYVQIDGEYVSDVPAVVNFVWQPMDASKASLPTQIYPTP